MALAISATYNNDFGRVQVTFSGANADADYARVEHSLDQINWSTIRGGDAVPLSGGSGHIDHYDGYTFGVANYYRVTAIDGALVQPVGSGAMAAGNNATLNPALPGGLAAGHMMILKVSHRATAATITTPLGWTRVLNGASHFAHFYKAYAPGDTAPSVAFSGGAAGDSCSAQVHAFSNAQAPTHVQMLTNVADQNVAYPGGSTTQDNPVWFMDMWKQSAATGASAPPSFGDQQGGSNTAGANAESHISWRTAAETNLKVFSAGVSNWSGGSSAISKARLLLFLPRDFTDQGTYSFTPVFPNKNTKPYWLMNPSRPGQNIRVEITGFSEISNAGRTGVFEIVGRSYPVTISDVMESNAVEFTFDAATKTEAKELAARIALGDPMYLLVPDPDADIDTMYFTATAMKRSPDALGGSWSITVTAREVAQPAPAVYGSTYIWNDVVTDFASWTAVLADPQNTSWANLVDRISDDVIVVP